VYPWVAILLVAINVFFAACDRVYVRRADHEIERSGDLLISNSQVFSERNLQGNPERTDRGLRFRYPLIWENSSNQTAYRLLLSQAILVTNQAQAPVQCRSFQAVGPIPLSELELAPRQRGRIECEAWIPKSEEGALRSKDSEHELVFPVQKAGATKSELLRFSFRTRVEDFPP
jgi:hypothetical protein